MPHVQIRNMPTEMHRTFKIRAAVEGMSLSEYLLRELRPLAALPTLREFAQRLAELPETDPPETTSDAIRAERDRS